MADLKTRYLDLELKNPLIVASSGLTRNARMIARCEEAGAGAVVMKSIFEEDIRRKDNTFQDNLITHPEAADYLTAEVGMIYGPADYCAELEKARKMVSIPVIASVNCAEPRFWTGYASQIESAGASALELNLSVPSIELDQEGRAGEEQFYEIVSSVRAKVRIPLAVKMSGQLTCPQNVAEKLIRAGADGLVIFNRQTGLDIDLETGKAFASKGDQGLSSPHYIYYPLRWVAILSELLPGVSLSASGGVHSGEGLIKYILAGAHSVQVCSLFYREGLRKISSLLGALENYMENHGSAGVASIRGSARRQMPLGNREQQRLEYLELSKGRLVEADTADGGGLVYESHNQD